MLQKSTVETGDRRASVYLETKHLHAIDEYSNMECMPLLHTPPTGQVLFSLSQDSPVLVQCGPRMLGDTSPRFDEAKPATNGPCQNEHTLPFIFFL